jgi:hypothetical protein
VPGFIQLLRASFNIVEGGFSVFVLHSLGNWKKWGSGRRKRATVIFVSPGRSVLTPAS